MPRPRTTAKRLPRQARSRERVDAILDAAASLLRDGGLAAVSTNRIAGQAGVPVGSIYQYFDNKEDVVRQLGLRSLRRLDDVVDRLVAAEEERGWEELIDLTLETLARLYRSDPGFGAVWLGANVSTELKQADQEHDQELAARIDPILARAVPHLSRAERATACALLVQVTGSVVALAVRHGPRRGRRILEEGKRMLKAYVRDHVERTP